MQKRSESGGGGMRQTIFTLENRNLFLSALFLGGMTAVCLLSTFFTGYYMCVPCNSKVLGPTLGSSPTMLFNNFSIFFQLIGTSNG